MSQAKDGDLVKIHFTGKTEDGNVFASSYGQEPLEFKIGEGQMLPGIEKAVTGMNIGEQRTTRISPEEGYGPHLKELILEVERAQFPNGFIPEVGMVLQVPQPDGLIAILTVLAVGDSTVRLDANHPLAGKNLTFDLELLEIA